MLNRRENNDKILTFLRQKCDTQVILMPYDKYNIRALTYLIY